MALDDTTSSPDAPGTPFIAGQSRADIDILAKSSLLSTLGVHDLSRVMELLDQIALPRGTTIFREGEAGDSMFFVLEGRARVQRGAFDIAQLGPGDHFGELALVGQHPRPTTVYTDTVVRLARLPRARFTFLAERHPSTALHFLGAVASSLGASMTAITDDVDQLLRQRTLPRRSTVHVTVGDQRTEIGTGTLVGTLLPRQVEGALVVAALLDGKAVSLEKAIVSDGRVEPMTIASWEGRRIYRRSVGLLFLEAAREIAPEITFTLGARRGNVQRVAISAPIGREQAAAIEQHMRVLADASLPLREELWGPEEVRARFEEQGWHDAASLLPFYREEAVPVLVAGKTVALGLGPVVPRAADLTGFSVTTGGIDVELHFGRDLATHGTIDRRTSALPVFRPAAPPASAGMTTPPPPPSHADATVGVPVGVTVPPAPGVPATAPMARPAGGADPRVMQIELGAWLRGMNVTSVGRFDAACVAGQVAEIIRVSEGFHEKHVGRVADAITKKHGMRLVGIAGPSSSGKTTFIKRLKVQLEVNGIVPVHLSLDDYYVDRERTPKDESGEWDFESIDALDHALMREHIGRLLDGETVKTARYDFVSGKSLKEGGPEVKLGESCILLLEGLHALNPAILGVAGSGHPSFRVFVHPATALPFDRLSPVLPEDIRLLRRIVRDRHGRGYAAADSIARWPSVRRGEEKHVLPWADEADIVFDTSLVYEPAVLRVYAERYLLEVPRGHPSYVTAHRLRQLVDRFVPIHADHVPATSLLREFIGGSGFDLV